MQYPTYTKQDFCIITESLINKLYNFLPKCIPSFTFSRLIGPVLNCHNYFTIQKTLNGSKNTLYFLQYIIISLFIRLHSLSQRESFFHYYSSMFDPFVVEQMACVRPVFCLSECNVQLMSTVVVKWSQQGILAH